jgi:hypothetical protein
MRILSPAIALIGPLLMASALTPVRAEKGLGVDGFTGKCGKYDCGNNGALGEH